MPRYPSGQPVRLSTTVRDVAGALATPGGISLTLQRPDATFATFPTPATDGTGLYHQDLSTTDLAQLGHHQYRWTSTGTAAGVSFGSFDVFDPFEAAVLTLQDAKTALNIPAATTRYDTEIQDMLATIQAMLERFTGGPLVNRACTDFVQVGHGYRTIALRQRPLVSVTAITDNATGTALPLDDIDVDANAGIIRRRLQLPFWSRGPYYTVAYVAGWGTAVEPAFGWAARVILQHMWQTQMGPSARPSMAPDELATTWRDVGLGFSVPNRALELLAPYMLEAFV